MRTRILLLIFVFGMALFPPVASWADVPPPPANQWLGMPDVSIVDLTEADCRFCHDSGVPDSHHALYGSPIPAGSIIPYPEVSDTYTCIGCHGPPDANGDFVVERNCVVCHTAEPTHHVTTEAQAGNCEFCHGSFVTNMDDGHTIPSYGPTLVTPSPSGGDGLPANSRGTLAGSCKYCHDDDGLTPPVISTNVDLHHRTGLGSSDGTQCMWCHDLSLPAEEKIRPCEGCHGFEALHNIQADSPATPGILVIGGEDPGYGHIGSEYDCWGCHGFAKVASPTNNPDLHHNLYGDTIPTPTVAPYGTSGDPYGCLSCHGVSFTVERNCLACHTTWDPDYAEDVVTFFEESVDSGDLEGVGPGSSANNKLKTLNNMLENIVDLIEAGDITGACQQISDTMKKCDGTTPPPDFVTGDDRAGLYSLLDGLWLTYGCSGP